MRPVEGAGSGGVRVERTAIDRRPAPVRVRRQVGDDKVGVKVRVPRAARPVEERRRHESRHRHDRAGTAHVRGVPLEVAEGAGDGVLVRGAHLPDGVGRAEGVEQAHRLGSGEGAVEGGDRDPAVPGVECRPGRRIHAGEQRRESGRLDASPGQAEVPGEAPPPEPVGLDETPTIAPRPSGRLEVVPLAPRPHLRQAQHRRRR